MLNFLSNSLSWIKETLSVMGSIFIIVGCVALIVLSAYIAMKIPTKILAVIFSTICTALLMTPILMSANVIIDKKVATDLAKKYQNELELKKKEIELAERKAEIEKQKLVNLRQKVNIENLENEVTLLKNSQLQINSYREIAEINLLETNLKQTTFSKKILDDVKENKRGWWVFSDKYAECDSALVVLTHDIVAKFGFDINEIRLMDSKEAEDVVLVSKVKPKFTGSTKNQADKIFAEVLHEELDIQKAQKDGIDIASKSWKDFPSKYLHGSILFEREAEAIRYADKLISEFNERFSRGLETQFLNKPLEKLCEKFVRSMLLPLNKKIVFSEEPLAEALSIEEYFKTKIEAKEQNIKYVQDSRRDELIKQVNREVEQAAILP